MFPILLGLFQLVSPSYVGTSAALAQRFERVLWIMDAEMGIDTRNNDPELMNARTWRARKRIDGSYDWQNVALSWNGSQSHESGTTFQIKTVAGVLYRRTHWPYP